MTIILSSYYEMKSFLVLQCTMAQYCKIGKRVQFQKCKKKHYLHFQKGQKNQFCTRKKFKTTKNAIFGLKKTGYLVVLNFFQGQK